MAAMPEFGRPFSFVRSLVPKATVGRDLWRIHGGAKFLTTILPWGIQRRYLFYEGSLAPALPKFEPRLEELHVTPATPSDLPLVLKARPGYYSLGELRERLNRGQLCFLARVDGEPVNIRWAFIGSVHLPYIRRTLVLPPDEFYFDEVFTVPRWRHRGIDEQTFRFMRTWFRDRGYKKQCCFLTPWDTHLHKRYGSLGLAKTGEVRSRTCGFSTRLDVEGLIRDFGRGMIAGTSRKVAGR
jgi:GNAT superfamily N-acetyltransferase